MGQFNRGDIIVHLVLIWRETILTELFQPKCRKQKLKLMPPPLRKSKAPSGRRKKRSMGPKSKRQKMAPMVPETEPQLKKMEQREKKRKMVRAKKKRKEMTKFLFLLSPNLVISYYIYQIRHLIIISALLTKKKVQEEIDCVSSKNTPIQRFE